MLLNDMHRDWNSADDDHRDTLVALNTDGSGLWSDDVREVRVTALSLGYVSEDQEFGELRVHFNTNSWRPDINGLIYTDEGFMESLADWLTGVQKYSEDAVDEVDYSEQGMQGDNYVSFDVGAEFLKEYAVKNPEQYKAALELTLAYSM